jgi:hypothetical protein
MWDDYVLWPDLFGLLWVAYYVVSHFCRSRYAILRKPALWMYGEPIRDKACLICNRSWRIAGPFVEISARGDCLCGDCIDVCRGVLDTELRRTGRIPPELDETPADTSARPVDPLADAN